MNFKRFITSLLLAMIAVVSFHAAARNITAGEAQAKANSFIKSHAKASPGLLNAPAQADIVLTYAEPSSLVAHSNVYYIFNIKGGGFIIISGEDRAATVLGYSDKGHIDMANMSEPLKDLLDGYKMDIEFLQTHKIDAAHTLQQRLTEVAGNIEPLMKTTWGPEDPYNYQCPMLNGQYSKAGCAAVCMAQTMYFWRFPTSSPSFPSYYCSYLGENVPALPETTFDYSKMILSYSHWDDSKSKVVLDTFTDEQAQEVAKLIRYCGQSVKMNYSPSLSMTTNGKLAQMIKFGYNSSAKNLTRANYDLETWEALMMGELNAGRPIMYAGYASSSVGHAFLVDGHNDEGYYHMNMGWYGYNDGWYLLDAIIFTNRYGEYRHYKNKHSMLVGIEPPLFCTINTEIIAENKMFTLGETMTPQATNVDLNMSYRTLPFMFSLTDAQGNHVALSESVTLNRLTFEQGSDIALPLTLPESLPNGNYNLNLSYSTGDDAPLTVAVTADGQLHVAGRFAKYGAPFDIGDVVQAIDIILNQNAGGVVSIADVIELIDYILIM